MSFVKGISVLVCTYNGAKRLPETLEHIASQEYNNDIPVELLIIDNASTDDTVNVANDLWSSLKCSIPFKIYTEAKKGKSNAIDKGLSLSKYQYVVICDDDNWLDKKYIQHAYEIMSSNENIGILGGQGFPSDDLDLPNWFSKYQTYFAIGDQGLVSGEIKHFWPIYKFIWGAGAVINKKAITKLQNCGFERILTHKKVGRLSRSEDLELCFAIWLTGYKLWYDKRLRYKHAIDQNRLTWDSFMDIVKISVPGFHLLRPYNVLIFTGYKNAPTKSYWKEHVLNYLSLFRTYFNSAKDYKIFLKIILGRHEENAYYMFRVNILYQIMSAVKMGRKYDKNFKHVCELQKRLSLEVDNYDQKILNNQ